MSTRVRWLGLILLTAVAAEAGYAYSPATAGRLTEPSSTSGATPPPCTSVFARGHLLTGPKRSFVTVAGNPWGVVTTPDGRWSFVSQTQSGKVAMFSDVGFVPRLVRELALPFGPPGGEALTPDGRYLLVADGAGAIVVSTTRAEHDGKDAVLGTLSAGSGAAVGVLSSPDGKFAFVTLETTDQLAVFDLAAAITDHFRSSHLVGAVQLGHAVVGIASSHDGHWLYVTSEIAAGRPISFAHSHGTLSVLNLYQAETKPSAAVVATVPAGCGPVRTLVSPDDRVVWVTARESNSLLAFSAAKLRSDPRHALLSRTQVGQTPVGLALLDRGRLVVVADSNRFHLPGSRADLTVVSAAAAIAGKRALLGTIPTGLFPRDLATEPTRPTLLVTNFDSDQLEAIDTATIP